MTKECPLCGSQTSEAGEDAFTDQFNDAMEWYFKDRESGDWLEFLEWKNSKDDTED